MSLRWVLDNQIVIRNFDLKGRNRKKEWTQLHHACRDGRLWIAQACTKFNIDDDINAEAKGSGRTPLHVAAVEGHVDIAKFLLKSGADLYRKESDNIIGVGKLPIALAISSGEIDMVKLLLTHQNKDEDEDEDTNNNKEKKVLECEKCIVRAFHEEIYKGHIEMCQVLIAYVPDIANARRPGNKVPLTVSCDTGNTKITKLLISSGAEVNAIDIVGSSPLHYASYFGREKCCKILLNANASVNMTNNEGGTPLDLTQLETPMEARMKSRKNIAVLLKAGESRVLVLSVFEYVWGYISIFL